jgi:glutamyl-tRNA reductase
MLTSTGAASLMVEHGDLEATMAGRPGAPLLIVDIAVPRDVDPAAADIPGVTLLDMDDLRRFAEIGLRGRRAEVVAVRAIVDAELERFVDTRSAREAAPLVAELRTRADEVRQVELERFREPARPPRRARPRDRRGAHPRCARQAPARAHGAAEGRGGSPRGDRLAETLRDLFDL